MNDDIDHLRELLDTKLEAYDKALTLQAEEYQRRLHDLNGEAARLRSIQASYVPRETYEAYVREQVNSQAALKDALEDTRERLEKSTKDTTDRLEKAVDELRLSASAGRGHQLGMAHLWAGVVAFAGVAVAIISLAWR